MTDFASAVPLFVPRNRVFINQNVPKWVVIHKTAGGGSIEDLGAYFATTPEWTSAHYGVGLDGRVAQFVLEQDGAAANCCIAGDSAPFLVSGVNYNLETISIEHIDPAIDNSTEITSAQKASSFKLVADICRRQRIAPVAGTSGGGILRHCDFDSVTRARCPGNYPMEELLSYLKGSVKVGIPEGWADDGKNLWAPDHKYPVVMGFRQFILSHPWDKDDYPVEASRGLASVEQCNPARGKGTAQTFRRSRLAWTEHDGVFLSWLGSEYLWYVDALAKEAQTKIQVVTKNELPSAVKNGIKQLAIDAGYKVN